MRHFRVVIVDSVEGGLILQAEHEDDGVDPSSELQKGVGTVLGVEPAPDFPGDRSMRDAGA